MTSEAREARGIAAVARAEGAKRAYGLHRVAYLKARQGPPSRSERATCNRVPSPHHDTPTPTPTPPSPHPFRDGGRTRARGLRRDAGLGLG